MKALEPRQEAFVIAYARCLNVKEAAALAGYSEAERSGFKLLHNPRIRRGIMDRLEQAQIAAGVPDNAEILRRLHAVAWADPNELISQVVQCCRHCHGEQHAYQWKSEQEWAEACEKALEAHEMKLQRARESDPPPQLKLPSTEGGFDFDAQLLPVDTCTHCDGNGVSTTLIKDTRFLSKEARWLYAGVKSTKDGIQIVMHDQLKMRELELRHRGLLNDKLVHITPGGAGALGIETDELAALTDEQLETIEDVQLTILTKREQKRLAAPPQSGEIIDV